MSLTSTRKRYFHIYGSSFVFDKIRELLFKQRYRKSLSLVNMLDLRTMREICAKLAITPERNWCIQLSFIIFEKFHSSFLSIYGYL